MAPEIVAAFVTAGLSGAGGLALWRLKARGEQATRWHAERYKAYTEFQQQCHDTFNQGRAVASAIVPPRPRDVDGVIAGIDAYQTCTCLANPRLNKSVRTSRLRLRSFHQRGNARRMRGT
jgi:hypothetical protein